MTRPADPPPPLATGAKLARLALIGGLLAGVAGAFAYAGGWFTPRDVTPAKFADAFEHADGVHPGYRRNHAKGVCVAGTFEPSGAGERLSRAAVFRAGQRVPIVGRFSLGGGMPNVADSLPAVRGLGVQFSPAHGQPWRTAMVNLPVFPFRTPEAFYERLVASAPDAATGKPDPAKMAAFAAAHPEFGEAIKVITSQPPAAGFASTTFRGLNAFRMTDDAGKVRPVRWEAVPEAPPPPASPAPPRDPNYPGADETRKATPAPTTTATQPAEAPNFLFDALAAAAARGPLRWHLIVIVGRDDDPTDDATKPWPADRERVDVGTLVFDRLESDDESPTADLNFDPLVLPDGIAPGNDPIPAARSAVYARSLTRRAGEAGQKAPAAVTRAEIEKGGMK